MPGFWRAAVRGFLLADALDFVLAGAPGFGLTPALVLLAAALVLLAEALDFGLPGAPLHWLAGALDLVVRAVFGLVVRAVFGLVVRALLDLEVAGELACLLGAALLVLLAAVLVRGAAVLRPPAAFALRPSTLPPRPLVIVFVLFGMDISLSGDRNRSARDAGSRIRRRLAAPGSGRRFQCR